MSNMRIGLALLLLLSLRAGEAPSTAEVDRAVGRGLAFLRSQQQPDGGIGGQARIALSGLAVLAHLAAGITPDQPEHGPAVRRLLLYLLTRQEADGWLGGDNGRMYSHGIACLALVDALGTVRDDDLDERMREAVVRGLAVTVVGARVEKAPEHRGGWRYHPAEASSDLSQTGWQLLALHAARRVGLSVPDDIVTGAIGYVRGMVDADGRVAYDQHGQDRPALRGLALLVLALPAGERDPALDRILVHVREEPPAWQGPWFFYRSYYDAAGIPRADPRLWEGYRAALFRILLDHQAEDGSWLVPPGDNERENGPAYPTAMAVLALAMDRHLLPAHQP